MNPVESWFRDAVGEPFAFQRDAWASQLAGESGLLHAPTGMGKTYSAWLPSLMRWCDGHPEQSTWQDKQTEPIRVLWITPLRALATDTEENLKKPIGALGLPWTVERRTGDVSATVKARQKKRLPSALVTTPESLSVLLSYADARQKFRGLQTVIVDEWHELMSTKRGTQTELGLARLRTWNPELSVWGLSATLGNLPEAMDTLLGPGLAPTGQLIHGPDHKQIEITTLLPDDMDRFPWAGHLGITLLPQVLAVLENAGSTLLFTNTRSQAEIWFNEIIAKRPDWIGEVALHHGSIDRKSRQAVEDLLRQGGLRCCVCTSSLDLGVDFSPVEQVIQVASPKGVARLLQRAGRSGHQPGKVSRVIGVPTNALEIIDFAAARDAAAARRIESRRPLDRPLDVLAQHLVTCAMGGGFTSGDMLAEVRSSHAYRNLTDQEWEWCLDFVRRGGETLKVYPQYARVVEDDDGRFGVASNKIARNHRLGIGTITSDAAIAVKFANGKKLGTVEEGFVGFLKPGDKFVFAGHLLQLVRVRAMVATVKKAKGKKAQVPRWQGGRTPLSTQLADAVRARLDDIRQRGSSADDLPPEMRAVAPLLELQTQWSVVPGSGKLLIETTTSRDGHHTFLYPLQGRLVHEGLGTLLAHRLTREAPRAVTVTVNDYGIELLSPEDPELTEADWRRLLHRDDLLEHLLEALNTSQLARRAFRDIARVAGLIQTGYPGQQVTNRHLQASSELFFDVFTDFDPDNLLLDQARREVLEQQLEVTRLTAALKELEQMRLEPRQTERLTPMAFPLWAERLREQHLTSQSWQDQVGKMVMRLEAAAGR
ncbi:ligase-associated DNA damage response DEXH box helicase [Algisphaera agarilytica]|uniref:ATP-dependent Lhr-like helicase n=1 Tax=Algisphaera agarilytica TaxID=1385975 RepID=A0A7X0LLM1_9BACT|nr:ligase-associated DNA damage response DEXH box helicase [Algisphaera agarilytica]MBB6431655.1 ATP-dependent Lhr-like helicase [Algisphaera agarilytica]